MDDDYDPNVSGGGSRGSTSLPKFNHLYPILFFSHFIRFCGANKCGGPLSSPDGRIESARAGWIDPEDEDALAEYYSSLDDAEARRAQSENDALANASARSAQAVDEVEGSAALVEDDSVVGSECEFEARRPTAS